MSSPVLDKELFPDTSICNLLLRLSDTRLDVAVYSVVAEGSLVRRSFSLVSPTRTPLEMLEDTVYENPLLLSDFRRTFLVAATPRTIFIPSEAAADAAGLFKLQYPDFDGECRVSATGTADAVCAWGFEADTARFVSRTFAPDTVVDSSLATLCRYFAARPGRGASTRMACVLREGSADIIAICGHSLRMAVTVGFASVADLLYRILNSRRLLGLDPQTDELLLAGNQALREQISPLLRRYVASVMPAIFPPQMFNAGREAMLAPFDMIISPLCE